MHLGGFIIRIYHDARSHECQILSGVSASYTKPDVQSRFFGLSQLCSLSFRSSGIR